MAATYRIGPADFFTGADLQADADTLNSQVSALDRLYAAEPAHSGRVSSDLDLSWNSFTAMWDPYFAQTYQNASGLSNFLTALNDGNRDQLIQYENRFADLQAQFKAAGISSVFTDVAVSLGAPDTVTSLISELDAAAHKLLPFGLGLGALIVLIVFAWYFLIPRLTHA